MYLNANIEVLSIFEIDIGQQNICKKKVGAIANITKIDSIEERETIFQYNE